MAKRINVILRDDTIRIIDRMAQRGQRSRFIERAVQHYVTTASPEALHQRLKAAAVRDRDLDLTIAQDWYAVDQEQWQPLAAREKRAKEASQGGAKSTSRRSTRR